MSTSTPVPAPVSNVQRQADALERKINRQHRWRTQVWASCELRIRTMQGQLVDLGFEAVAIAGIDFSELSIDELTRLADAGSDD